MSKDQVTLRDVYDAINRVEDKFDKRLTKAEKDIDDLNSFQNKALGVLSIIALFGSVVSTYIWNKIIGKSV